MPNHLVAALAESCDINTCTSWSHVPDNLLLLVFSYLQPAELLTAVKVCRQWHCVGLDDLLWKELLYRYWRIDHSIPRAPGKKSWLSEFKRLYCKTPSVESEVICEHRDQVLHVAFSHNGKMISSCSKDGYVKVWNSTYPISLKCYADMKELTWKYTQFSQFNASDTHLLVSGVHFGSNSTSGEIVIFNLIGDKFELQCRVLNKPYDVFGAWYNNDYLLSGNIHWQGNYTSCSVLWLNKASQALESEHESVVMRMYKFLNINASSVRTIMVADCQNTEQCNPSTTPETSPREQTSLRQPPKPKTSVKKIQMFCEGEGRPIQLLEVDDLVSDEAQLFGRIEYGAVYRNAEAGKVDESHDIRRPSSDESEAQCSGDVASGGVSVSSSVNTADQCTSYLSVMDSQVSSAELVKDKSSERLSSPQQPVHPSTSDSSLLSSCSCHSNSSTETASTASHVTPSVSANQICSTCQGNQSTELCDKLLVFTMGTKTYTPHQIGIKRISTSDASQYIKAMKYRQEGSLAAPPAAAPQHNVAEAEPVEAAANQEQQLVDELANQDAHGIKAAENQENIDVDEIANKEVMMAIFDEEIANQEAMEAKLDAAAAYQEPAVVEDDMYDSVDHLIELHGHIIGMCLSPDHRYLYVNSRPWPKNYVIDDPLYPPPIAQEIDIHVIDLSTMKEVGTMYRAHKAYTPNDECFFIFLDVCKEYVASGAENKHGYLWDRHYGVCLARYPHTDVVNCVAFNPCNPEMLITASDDHTMKVWRSRDKAKYFPKKTQ